MSKIVIKPIEEQIRGARIAGELARAEERGYAKGFEEGRAKARAKVLENIEKKFVLRLLKTHTPEEISRDYDIPLERIHEIIDDIIKQLWEKTLSSAGKSLINEEKIKEFMDAVKMSKIVIKPIEEQIRGARIAGELARAEERGYAKGFNEVEEKFVLGLLKAHTPEEISKDFDVSLERIHEIINDNSWKSYCH